MSRHQDFVTLMENLHEYSQQVDNLNKVPHVFAEAGILYMAELHVLKCMEKFGLSTVTDIARHQNKTTSAISQLVKKLLGKGLLAKNPDPANKKNTVLSITELGRSIGRQHESSDYGTYMSIMDVVAGFEDEELRIAARMVNSLTCRLRDPGGREPGFHPQPQPGESS